MQCSYATLRLRMEMLKHPLLLLKVNNTKEVSLAIKAAIL